MSSNNTNRTHRVYVNMYSMISLNVILAPLGIGVFHSGVEVCGEEYFFAGHPFDSSGICMCKPKEAQLDGTTITFKKRVLIGETDKNKGEIHAIIDTLGRDFRGNDYTVLDHNCNHFSKMFSDQLIGTTRRYRPFPKHVNRIASILGKMYEFLPKFVKDRVEGIMEAEYERAHLIAGRASPGSSDLLNPAVMSVHEALNGPADVKEPLG